MAKKIFIGGSIESREVGGIVTKARFVKDDTLNKTQREINSDVQDELSGLHGDITALQDGKQDVLTFDNAPTEGSNNPVKSGGIYTAQKALSDAIEAILVLIPSAATALNKLADIAFVNSSVSTNTATFRGTSATGLTEEQFLEWADSLTHDLNDYVYWNTRDAVGNTEFKRYKWDGTQWLYEYTLNNSSFTAVQWAAINSGITAAFVAKLNGLPDSVALQAAFDAITSLIPSEASDSNKLADKVWVTALVNAINALIPEEASDSNQLADKTYVGNEIASAILAAIPAFKGQFITLAELQAVESPKDGDLGIVRTTDSDGHAVYTFYQYLNDGWNEYYALHYQDQHKPATTGSTGNYPYNGMGRIELPKNFMDFFPSGTWGMVVRNDVAYLIFSYQMQYYAVYDEDNDTGLILENNLVVEQSGYDLTAIADIVGENVLSYTEAGGVYTITKPDTTTVTSTELNNTHLWFWNNDPKTTYNVLLQSMFTQTNTVYVIRYDYDLMQLDITIPAGCLLEFDGGSINNGKVISNRTKVINALIGDSFRGIFYDVNNNPLSFNYATIKGISNSTEHGYIATVDNKEAENICQGFVVTPQYFVVFVINETTQSLAVDIFDKTYTKVGHKTINVYGHANDATYCPKDNCIYIAQQDPAGIYKFDANELGTESASITIERINVLEDISFVGIDYNANDDEFALYSADSVLYICGYDFSVKDTITGLHSKFTSLTQVTGYVAQSLIYRNGQVLFQVWMHTIGTYHSGNTRFFVFDINTGDLIDLGHWSSDFFSCEPEGIAVDTDDESIIYRTTGLYDLEENRGITIEKTSFEKDVNGVCISYNDSKSFASSSSYRMVYVNSDYVGISTGSSNKPFKSLDTAMLLSFFYNHIDIRITNDKTYYIGQLYLRNTDITIRGYGYRPTIVGSIEMISGSVAILEASARVDAAVTDKTYFLTISDSAYGFIRNSNEFEGVEVASMAKLRFGISVKLTKGVLLSNYGEVSFGKYSVVTYSGNTPLFTVEGSNKFDFYGLIYNQIQFEQGSTAKMFGTVPAKVFSIVVENQETILQDTINFLIERLGGAIVEIFLTGNVSLPYNNNSFDVKRGTYYFNGFTNILLTNIGGSGPRGSISSSATGQNPNYTEANLPNWFKIQNAEIFWDSNINRFVYKSSPGNFFVDRGYSPLAKTVGNTTNRPDGNLIRVGFQYFDTTLNKPIWAKTIASTSPYTVTWVDATGATV